MSKLVLCSVLDSKVGSFSPPFACKSRGEAIRSFNDAVGDSSMPFGKHPGDYTLFCLAEFDDNSGTVVGVLPDRLIGADEFS